MYGHHTALEPIVYAPYTELYGSHTGLYGSYIGVMRTHAGLYGHYIALEPIVYGRFAGFLVYILKRYVDVL